MTEVKPREFLYVGVFRVPVPGDGDPDGRTAAAVHASFLDALKERGVSEVPGEILAKEFCPIPEIACDPKNEGRYVMASDAEALMKLGLSFEAANRLVPVVTLIDA